MNRPSHRRAAFTLVEIMIVVIILGILAAIVIPKFTDASDLARGGAVLSQLETIRKQIQVYKLDHNDTYPTLAQLQATWGVLLSKTDEDGTINASGRYGPYIKMAPVNAFTNSTTVADVGGGTTANGWEYDASDGTITAVGFDETTKKYTAP